MGPLGKTLARIPGGSCFTLTSMTWTCWLEVLGAGKGRKLPMHSEVARPAGVQEDFKWDSMDG